MNNFQNSISVSDDATFPIVQLYDRSGAQVKIAPAAGFNAFSFRIANCSEANGDEANESDVVRVLVEPENEAQLRGGGFGFGYPLLFPLPNRTRVGRYQFEGETHQLDINYKDGNAIHGLVCDRAWTLSATGADDERGAWATANFDTRHFPEVLRQYPFECVITATYTLRDSALNLAVEVENVGARNLPMGFGIHPWFPFPFSKAGKRAECTLKLPVKARWVPESSTQFLPTGEILPIAGTKYDFRKGRALGEIFLDEVFTGLEFGADGIHRAQASDPASGVTIEIESMNVFREFVVYAPLHREILCLEPYTGTTDTVNLQNAGIDAGLIVLAPEQTWKGEIRMLVIKH